MPVEVIRTGRLAVDQKAVASFVAQQAIGRIKRRTARGVDMNDRPFAPYSRSYSRSLVAIGERLEVDLTLTGGLMRAIHVVREVAHRDRVIIVLGFRGTSSPRVAMPGGHWSDESIQSWIESHGGGRAKRTGKQGPPHARVAYWLHHGTPKMPARPFFALSPSDVRAILREVVRWNRAIVLHKGKQAFRTDPRSRG